MILLFIPRLLLAIVIRVIARTVAKALKAWLILLFQKIGLETLAERAKIKQFLQTAHIRANFSTIIADLVYRIIYLIGINIAFETLGLYVISNLISDLIVYIPNLFVAVLIILVGAFVARLVRDITDAAVVTSKTRLDRLGQVMYIVVMIFVLVTALKQAQIDISFLTENINTIVMGIMLALGLAFWLWGKDKAKEIIEKYIK